MIAEILLGTNFMAAVFTPHLATGALHATVRNDRLAFIAQLDLALRRLRSAFPRRRDVLRRVGRV